MEWHHPEALYLILPLTAAWLVLALHGNHRRHVAREAFAARTMWSRILPGESRVRFWMKLALREMAIVMGLVALAGPQFGVQYEQVVPRGSDLYVLIDVSRSMLADDVPPSRLGRAKADVSSLVNHLEGERIGLIAFAGQAVVKCPLTIDYDSFRRTLEELDPDSAPRGGTAIGDAIRKALEVFHAKADRDQAILLITDGDDQQSYPLEAAAVAAERHVTIFTVGLGDAERGARIPQKANINTYLEYQGQQVWSKLDGNLLRQIALKTSGVYVPAGTRAYDLGEVYQDHLKGRRGSESATQQRIRRSERFQSFLALSLLALLADLCIAPYRRGSSSTLEVPATSPESASGCQGQRKSKSPLNATSSVGVLILFGCASDIACAVEPSVAVRDGLRLYSKEQYEEAREKFASASEELDKQKSKAASIAAFDEACAAHRKGDLEHAQAGYLRAGLSQDLSIAVAAHFNLGNLAAEQARKLCGDKPELVPVDKRQEILDQLAHAIAAFRHCLELQPDHAGSRRNLELVRQWIKYYTDKWHELDRQKRRDESNLIQFLEFLIQTETSMREAINHLPTNLSSNDFAELKRAQDELREEIPTLRDKISSELRPPADPQSPTSNAGSQELEEGIAMLRGWADTAVQKMAAASGHLTAKEPAKAASEQQLAIDELDKIWEAVIPFHPLLAKALADQTSIAKTLGFKPTDTESDPDSLDPGKPAVLPGLDDDKSNEPAKATGTGSTSRSSSPLELADDDLAELQGKQKQTLKRTRLLVPKAEAELERLEKSPSTPAAPSREKAEDAGNGQQQSVVDPEQAKAGYRKAIELAPQAVKEMEAAVNAMKQKNRQSAGHRAEAARQILEEIQKAQPENKQQQDQKDDPQKNEDQKKKQDDKKDDSQKQDEKDNEKEKGQDKKEHDQKDQEKPSKDESSEQSRQKPQEQMSQDRMEDALRKVRERQQEKRERDRKLKGQFLGRSPVDKDW